MPDLLVFQSLWAMQHLRGGPALPAPERVIPRIAAAGFAGVSTDFTRRDDVARIAPLLHEHHLGAEAQCFPTCIDDLKPVLENAVAFGARHLALQPDLRPRRLADCIPVIVGWRRLATEAGIPLYIETHRDRMTNDLFFLSDLLAEIPDLPLLADLSHYVVAREMTLPLRPETAPLIDRILENAGAFHGRVAGSGQVQLEISFPQHRPALTQFEDWWRAGFRAWRRRAPADAALVFTCELGPPPYAITGPDGQDTTDRWTEALELKRIAERLWQESAA